MQTTGIVLRQFSEPPPSALNLLGPLMPDLPDLTGERVFV